METISHSRMTKLRSAYFYLFRPHTYSYVDLIRIKPVPVYAVLPQLIFLFLICDILLFFVAMAIGELFNGVLRIATAICMIAWGASSLGVSFGLSLVTWKGRASWQKKLPQLLVALAASIIVAFVVYLSSPTSFVSVLLLCIAFPLDL
jgi:hypothetical protein